MQIVIKIHSRCNINCAYCYMYNKGDSSYLDKPKRLPFSAIEQIPAMIGSYVLENPGSMPSLCFHGGEPLLVGKEYFRRAAEFLRSRPETEHLSFSLQTNAILIDQDWLDLFRIYKVGVSASLDGPPHVNDRLRLYRSGKGTSSGAVAGITKLLNSDVNFAGVICVINPDSSGAETVDYFIDELKLKWFDFLLPDYTHDEIPVNWPATQEKFIRFLTAAFDQWFERIGQGVSCRFFESIIARGLERSSSVDTIGRDGVATVILETNGTLEPHDVARICVGFDRYTGIPVGPGALQKLLSSWPYRKLENTSGIQSEQCKSCYQFDVCRGGHLFHRYKTSSGFSNPSVHCRALLATIDHVNSTVSKRLSNLVTS